VVSLDEPGSPEAGFLALILMDNDWSIQSRGDCCASTGQQFAEGEFFYTLLFEEGEGYRREDWSEDAFKQRAADAPAPYSFWRTKYEAPPAAPPEALGKQTAEDLLRRYMEETTPQQANARYILALMLERKRILKEREVKQGEDGKLTRIYEHAKSGEVFVIPDPGLRLDQLGEVQMEVAAMMGGPEGGSQQ
jgi:hypothetical protein